MGMRIKLIAKVILLSLKILITVFKKQQPVCHFAVRLTKPLLEGHKLSHLIFLSLWNIYCLCIQIIQQVLQYLLSLETYCLCLQPGQVSLLPLTSSRAGSVVTVSFHSSYNVSVLSSIPWRTDKLGAYIQLAILTLIFEGSLDKC